MRRTVDHASYLEDLDVFSQFSQQNNTKPQFQSKFDFQQEFSHCLLPFFNGLPAKNTFPHKLSRKKTNFPNSVLVFECYKDLNEIIASIIILSGKNSFRKAGSTSRYKLALKSKAYIKNGFIILKDCALCGYLSPEKTTQYCSVLVSEEYRTRVEIERSYFPFYSQKYFYRKAVGQRYGVPFIVNYTPCAVDLNRDNSTSHKAHVIRFLCGLAFLLDIHSKGQVHGDISPSNMLVLDCLMVFIDGRWCAENTVYKEVFSTYTYPCAQLVDNNHYEITATVWSDYFALAVCYFMTHPECPKRLESKIDQCFAYGNKPLSVFQGDDEMRRSMEDIKNEIVKAEVFDDVFSKSMLSIMMPTLPHIMVKDKIYSILFHQSMLEYLVSLGGMANNVSVGEEALLEIKRCFFLRTVFSLVRDRVLQMKVKVLSETMLKDKIVLFLENRVDRSYQSCCVQGSFLDMLTEEDINEKQCEKNLSETNFGPIKKQRLLF